MKKQSGRPGADPPKPQKRSRLLRRVLGGLKKDPPADLPAAGQRSGEGTESLEAFLEQERNTKPGPLE